MAKHADGGIDQARLDVRFAGYCSICDRIVERADDGSCSAGHPAENVAGRIVLVDGEPVPHIPAFNLAAFLLPFIWGPAHEEWVGAIFLPIWLFLDSIVAAAKAGGVPSASGATLVVVGTLAFQAFYAKRANGIAFRKVMHRMTAEQYTRRQRWWAIGAIPGALVLAVWTIWFHLFIAPRLPQQ